jgi:hypothetical protein
MCEVSEITSTRISGNSKSASAMRNGAATNIAVIESLLMTRV